MASDFSFLSLPRELRDLIYYHYVYEQNGYHYDYESGKLRADGPIDLAFMYTCTTVAAEMRKLALKTNTITFTTVYSESESLIAGRYHELRQMINETRHDAFKMTTEADLQAFRTPKVTTKLSEKYPQLLVDWDEWTHFMEPFWRFEAPSVYREFINEGVKLFSVDPNFVEAVAKHQDTHDPDFVRSPLFQSTPDPWTIPSKDEVLEMDKLFSGRSLGAGQEPPNFWRRTNWRFSAAAACIRFLKSIPHSVRLQLRKISLSEDHPSIADPRCHVLGLIPFCAENPQLHIERRVDLWRTIMGGHCLYHLYDELTVLSTDVSRLLPTVAPADSGRLPILECSASKSLSCWIAEALILPAAGLPANSFSLIIDGNDSPQRSCEVFEMFKSEIL